MAKEEVILSVRNLSIDFKSDMGTVRAVKSVSFDIPKGKTVDLLVSLALESRSALWQ